MNPVIERLGWTLVHSLWEVALIWVGLQVTLAFLRRSSARLRYLAGCTALAIAMLAPAATYLRLTYRPDPAIVTVATGAPSATLAPALPTTGHIAASPGASAATPWLSPQLRATLSSVFPWLMVLWGAVCVWSIVRLALAWRATVRLAESPRWSLPKSVELRCWQLAEQMELNRPVPIGETDAIDVPSVVGSLKPVILVPIGAFDGLTRAQVDSILAHELAHILRHDFTVNVLQSLSEILFFYHPAVRAMSQTIRVEREHACDELAVELVGDPRGYAEALAQLEEARRPALTLALAGESGLMQRVRRIIAGLPASSLRHRGAARAVTALSALALSALVIIPLFSLRLAGAEQATAPAPTAPADPNFPYVISVVKGESHGGFRNGDNMTITRVMGNRKKIEPGGSYLVEGTYTLGSATSATVALSLSSNVNGGRSKWGKEQVCQVERGSGTFSLIAQMPFPGRFHVSFYFPSGSGISGHGGCDFDDH